MSVTICDVAEARGLKWKEDGTCSIQAIHDLGLPAFGGCEICHASIFALNAHPSKSGYLRCKDCITDDMGFATVAEFENFEKGVVDADV